MLSDGKSSSSTTYVQKHNSYPSAQKTLIQHVLFKILNDCLRGVRCDYKVNQAYCVPINFVARNVYTTTK